MRAIQRRMMQGDLCILRHDICSGENRESLVLKPVLTAGTTRRRPGGLVFSRAGAGNFSSDRALWGIRERRGMLSMEPILYARESSRHSRI
jgi:hypothetical protein